MSSEDEEMEFKYRPDTPEDENDLSPPAGIPSTSQSRYNRIYQDFHKWNKIKGATPVSQAVLLKYFSELAERSKPPTLWAYYSMLKNTLKLYDNTDMHSWSKLRNFIKQQNTGYKSVKSKLFTRTEIEKFINEAPDDQWLDLKVVCIFAINGVYGSSNFVNIKIEHIQQYDDMFVVSIPKSEASSTNVRFTITGTYFSIVQKYVALRPKHAKDSRFFLQLRDGKCTAQNIGKNKYCGMPRRIANYLKLSKTERYTVLSFRINDEGRRDQNIIPGIDSPLNYQNSQDKASSVSYTAQVPIIASVTSNYYNGTETEHVCTISCGQVKCATEANERSVLHAFTLMKPPDYDVVEVIPAQYSSEPRCRWVVHYAHITDPVSIIDSDEKFEDITRSIPNNVKVNQKYVSGNSSQRSAAYVVVYSVNCRCQNVSSNVIRFTVNEIKSEM